MKWMLPLTGVALVLAGCSVAPTAGVIGPGMQVGASPTDIPFTGPEGRQTTFEKVRWPVSLVAFVSPPGETCCWINPKLVELSDNFADLPITVAQISEPTGKCPHGAGCVQACNLRQGRLVALCDPDRIAWKAYNQPQSGSVFLIDRSGKVVATGNVDALTAIADQARKMGKDAAQAGTRIQTY